MPWWLGSRPSGSGRVSQLLAAGVFVAFLVDEGLSATINIVYYSNSACTVAVPSAIFANKVLNTHCDNVVLADGSSRGYYAVCAKDSSRHASYTTTDMLLSVDNAGCGVSADGLLHYIQFPLSNVCWHPQGDRAVWVKWAYPPAGSSLCGETMPTSPSPNIIGDPITWHGNVREEFWLPNAVLSPLIRAPDLNVFASSRPGHTDDQWIDRIVITSVANEEVLDVSIKKNLTYYDRAALPENSFETLDVKMEWMQEEKMEVMPPGDAQFDHWRGIRLGFGRVRHFGQLKAGPAPRREAIYVTSKSLKILILSSSAREYFLESGELALEFSHLDIEIMEIADESKLTGILPELWGLVPMSAETNKLRKVSKDVLAAMSRLPFIVDKSEIPSPSVESNETRECSSDKCQAKDVPSPTPSVAGKPIASVEGFSGTSAKTHAEIAEAEIAVSL